MQQLLIKIKLDHPNLKLEEGDQFMWSPKNQTVFYDPSCDEVQGVQQLLHEVSHALLKHVNFYSDLELIQLEVAAWNHAKSLAGTYDIPISDDHMQNCLDTYRDWAFRRSTCPNCSSSGIQASDLTYTCLNCQSIWRVSENRLCRPYRLQCKTAS